MANTAYSTPRQVRAFHKVAITYWPFNLRVHSKYSARPQTSLIEKIGGPGAELVVQ